MRRAVRLKVHRALEQLSREMEMIAAREHQGAGVENEVVRLTIFSLARDQSTVYCLV